MSILFRYRLKNLRTKLKRLAALGVVSVAALMLWPRPAWAPKKRQSTLSNPLGSYSPRTEIDEVAPGQFTGAPSAPDRSPSKGLQVPRQSIPRPKVPGPPETPKLPLAPSSRPPATPRSGSLQDLRTAPGSPTEGADVPVRGRASPGAEASETADKSGPGPFGPPPAMSPKALAPPGVGGKSGADLSTFLPKSDGSLGKVTNPPPARGGAGEEPLEDAERTVPRRLRHRERAVTEEDFEALATETPLEEVPQPSEEAPPTEERSLNYEEIKATYTEEDHEGKEKGDVEYSWDVEEGDE